MPPSHLIRVTSPSSHRSEPSSSATASRRKVATIPPSARFNPPTPPSSPPPTQSVLHPVSPHPDIDSNYDSDDDEPPPFHSLFTFGRRIRRRQTDDESETPPRPTPPQPERKESKAAARLKTLGAAARTASFSPFRRASADDARPELGPAISAPEGDTGPSWLGGPVSMSKSSSTHSQHGRPQPRRAGTLDPALPIAEGSNSSASPRLSDQTDTALIRPLTPPRVDRPPVSTRRTAPGKLKIPRPSSLITRGTWFDHQHVAEPDPVADIQRDVFHGTERQKPRKKKRRFPQATMPPTPYNMTPRNGYWNTSNRSSLQSNDSPLGEGSGGNELRSIADRQRRFLGTTTGPPSPMSQPFHSATDYGFGSPNEKDAQATSSHGDGQLWRLVTCGMGGRGRAKELRARRQRRREEKPEDWRTRLRKWFILDGYVTLYIRVVTLACAITSLVLNVQTRGLQRDINLPGIMGASPILSLAFSVATIVHFFAVSHRELTGRPIGLWGLRSKMLWVCLDILFISFWSAYMSVAINDFIATPLECTGLRPWWRDELTDSYSHLLDAIASNSTLLEGATPVETVSETLGIILPSIILRSPDTRGICHRQAVSIGIGSVTLVLYSFNMVLSLFRIFETVRLSATGVNRSDLV